MMRGMASSRFNGAVLALDLATVTGYCYGKPGAAPPKFGHHRWMKQGQFRPQAYRQFRLWLDLWCSANKTDWIVYEAPIAPLLMGGQTNLNTIKLLVGLAEHLEEWAYQKVELRQASVAEVRSHFIGRNLKSAIAKPLTLQRCRDRGWQVETGDEADACALWDYQICCLRPDIGVKTAPLFAE
jgi:hypothetical protein